MPTIFEAIPRVELMHGQRFRSGAWTVEVLRFEAGSWGVFVAFEGRTLTADDVRSLMPAIANTYLDADGIPYADALRIGHRIAAQIPAR